MNLALTLFTTAVLMTEVCERLQAQRPQSVRRARRECPPEQMELVAIIACFRPAKLDHRPTAADLPKLGWRISSPGRWVDPIEGTDKAEGLALIIERDRFGFQMETFEPMSWDEGATRLSLRRPGRPVSLPEDERESAEEVRRREERRQWRKAGGRVGQRAGEVGGIVQVTHSPPETSVRTGGRG